MNAEMIHYSNAKIANRWSRRNYISFSILSHSCFGETGENVPGTASTCSDGSCGGEENFEFCGVAGGNFGGGREVSSTACGRRGEGLFAAG